jgi:hypothetical protein
MPANLIQGNFTTLLSSSVREDNGITKGGLIDQNYDGKIELYGQRLFMNFREGIDIRNDGDFNISLSEGDLTIQAETGHLNLLSGAEGATAIYINTTNPAGGLTMETGTAGTNMTTTGIFTIKSLGNDINIGYADEDFGDFDPATETQNVNIEAQQTVSINATDFQVVASDAITFIASEINFGPTPLNPFLRIVDDCLLIDSTAPTGLRKVMIDFDNDSLDKPGYNGILLESIYKSALPNNLSTEITLKSYNDINLSLGIEAVNSLNGLNEQYIAYKVGTKIIPLQAPKDFSINDIGQLFYWTVDEVAEEITGISTYITPSSTASIFNLTTGGTYTGTTTKYYKVEMDSTSTFKWSNNGGHTFQNELVAASTSPITLEEGITITFDSATGFAAGVYWTFTVMVVAETADNTNRNSQMARTVKKGISYLTVKETNDFQIKTSDQERLRITDNGQIGVGIGRPDATFEVTNKVGQRIILNTDYENQQINSVVAGLSNGGWVAVWESYIDATNKYDIYGQIFYPDGTRNGVQFKINSSTDSLRNQSFPSVAATKKPNSGRFLVVWSSDALAIGIYNVKGQIYDADLPDGSRKVGIEIPINTTATNSNKYPRACGINKPSQQYPYAIVWSSNYESGGVNTECYLKILSFNGNTIIEDTRVNTTTSLAQSYPDVSGFEPTDPTVPSGLVVAFMNEYDTGVSDIRYQLCVFDSSTVTKVGNEVVVSKTESNISLNPSKTFGRVSVMTLREQGFIISYNRSYNGNSSKLTIGDTITGMTSGGVVSLLAVDPDYPTKIKVQILSGQLLTGEEFTTNLSNRIEKIETISTTTSVPSFLPPLAVDQIEITLSRDVKVIQANRYSTSSETALYTISSVNTTPYVDDIELQQENPPEWIRDNTIFNYYYNLPVIAQTDDDNFVISWSNGSVPSIYYQKFNLEDGSKLGNEIMIQKEELGVKQRNPAIASIINKNNKDQGFVIVYDAETFDTSRHGVYAELVNNDNPLMKVWNGNGSMNFTNYGSLGLGITTPEGSIHVKNDDPSIILQNTNPSIGPGLGSSSIFFRDANNTNFLEIKGAYTTSYESRNPQFNNLVRWFKFNETRGDTFVLDSAKYQTNPTMYEFDIYNDWVPGKVDNALRFNGSSYLDCGNNADISEIAQGGFTISVWVKIFEGGSTGLNNTIISTAGTASGHYKMVVNGTSNLVGTLYTSSGFETVTSTVTVADGNWHNLIMLYDTTDIKLYIDGVFDNSTTIVGTVDIPVDITNIYLGTHNAGIDFFIGMMDDFRIYNIPLSEADITVLYQNISLIRGKLVFKTNNGEGIPESDYIRNFTIDADGFIENLRTRSLPDTTLSGTITPIGTTINGTNGTKFLSELNIGDTITLNNYARVITSITSDILAEVNDTYTGFASGPFNNVQRKPAVLSGLDADSNLRILLTAEGRLSIGRADTGAKLVISGTEDPEDYPNLFFKNSSTSGSTNMIEFYGKDALDAPYQIGKIQTDAVLTEGLLRFFLNRSSNSRQGMVLDSNGYLGLGGSSTFNPSYNLEIRDYDTNEVNLLMESGSSSLAIGGGASNIKFKSNAALDSYATIKGSSDSIVNDSKGRLDFITNDGSVDVSRFTIKSNNGVSFYLPEPVNLFHISPPYTSFLSGTVTLSGTTVTGVSTTFNTDYIGNIIYFIDDKISRVITGCSNTVTLTVSVPGTVSNPQSYYIYKPGFNMNSDGFVGMGTVQQTSSLHLQGSLASGTIKITYADTSLGQYDMTDKNYHTFLVDATGGQITMLLPPVSDIKGRIYNFKKIGTSSNIVVLNGHSSELIDQVAQYNMTIPYQCLIIQSDYESVNPQWHVISAASVNTTTIANTDYLPEGSTNLYFSNDKVLTYIENNITTDQIDEGVTNLYFSNARAQAAVADLYTAIDTLSSAFDPIGSAANVQTSVLSTIGALTTDDINEGLTQLYFTDARVATAIATSMTTQDLTVSLDIYRTVSNVTQTTSLNNSVTINQSNGLITTVQISLAPDSADEFVVNNSYVTTSDLVFAMINGKGGSPQSGLLVPIVSIYNVTVGSFNVIVRNPSSSTTCTGTYDIAYQIIKKI